MAAVDRLLVAQPRGLTAADNVALDAWVRDGGRLLLVLDPLITDHSAYHIGDKRRFNDVALLPPLLERWGLSMNYSEGVPAQEMQFKGVAIPAEEFGELSLTEGEADCTILANGLIAECVRGSGQALIVADAAFLSQEHGTPASDAAASAIFQAAFD